MYYKNTLKKRLLAIFLMIAMLIIPMDFNIGFAESMPQEDAIVKAIDWIKTNQNSDGSWGNSEIAFLDTSEVLDYLLKYEMLPENIQKSISWIKGLKILNNDMAARLLPYINDVDKHTSIKNNLIISQNKDGGWGIGKGYESDVLDTMLALNALVSDTNTDTLVIQKAVSYIISKQNSNGSWSYSGEGESVISLTAKVTITLSEFQTKTNLTSSDLQTAIRRAGEYLLSVQKPDKTWGIDEESIIDTVLSYHAVLSTIGVEPVDTIDTLILNVQNADGSWYESPYITALAIKAIKERKDLPNAKINSIKLLKNDNGTKTECYSYNAYETFEIQVDSTYNNVDSKLLYFVKQIDGVVVQANLKGVPSWNTSNYLPGTYSIIVAIQDNKTGGIIVSSEKKFDIVPTAKILDIGVNLDVDATNVGKAIDVNVQVTIVNASNIDKQFEVRTVVIDETQEVFHSEKIVESKAVEQTQGFDVLTFLPNVDIVKNYIVKSEVFDGDIKLADGQCMFKVLPLPPETRVDANQYLNKEKVYPGRDSVEATISLKGEGVILTENNNILQRLTPALQETGGYANGRMYNEFIEYAVSSGSNNGRFTVGTTGGNPENQNDNNKIMLFGHPSPWSSYTTIKIDGSNYIYDPRTKYPMPNASDLSNVSEYNVKNLSVNQIISIVPNTSTKRSDIVQIKYIIENNDTISHDVGVRIMLDTMLGDNDAAPFRIPGIGAVTTELELTGDKIPEYWQAFNSLTYPIVISQGTLLSNLGNKPDKVQFTNWRRVYNNAWLNTVNTGASNGDSAVSIYWNPNEIVPGEKKEYITYYGLSEFQEDLTAPLAVSLTGANNVEVVDNTYNPNPFTVTSYITNVSTNVTNNVKAKIILPDGLKLIDGQQEERNIGSLISRQEQQVSWNVEIEPSPIERNLTYSVIVSADGVNPKMLSRKIYIPALYDDTSGKNVVFETNIPKGSMQIESDSLIPAPTESIDNLDGSKTLKWNFDKIIIGEEKIIKIEYVGTELVADTVVLLTKNSKLSYQDRNNETVNVNLPDLKIPVAKYLLDSKVVTDKETYTANENINITNTTKNLTSYPSTLTGKVEITDVNGNIVKVIEDNVTNTWDAGESKNMEYSWNTCETLTGIYKARVIWSEGEKVISTAEVSFEIISNAPVSGTITVDKQQYASDEEVNINEIVKNNSTNNIENGITVKTTITNNEGTIIWTMDNMLSEILPNDNIAVKNIWNTAKNTPGQYIVTMEVYKGETKINQNSTKFEIVSETDGVVGISGTLNILKENIYPSDDVDFEYTINNTGNINISDVTARIRIVDTSTEEILGTLTDNMNIDISASNKQQKVWIHEPLKTGVYMVVLDAMFSNGKEISLSSGHIKVENPYETTINQVVRPRVLVWSESQENAEFASKTLSNMNVFYSIVSNAESFITELKTGKYNLYMLLDCKMPLTGEDDLLLADEIAKGKGIVVSGDSLLDNFKTLGIFGAKFRGYAGPTDYSVNFLENSLFGKVDLSGNGKVQILQLQEGEQQAIMESSKGSSPGVVFNQYQEGKAILFGFDIGSCSGETEILLRRAIELTTPINEIDQSYKEIEIKVSSKSSVDAQIKLLLPEGTDLIWSTPTIGADEMMWKFSTNANEEYKFRVFIKLPANLEQYEINAEACYSVSGQSFKFDTIKMIINNR